MRHGRVAMEWFESEVLRGNACGDPHVRRVPVYLPPAYDEDPGRRFPVAFVLAGFTGRGRKLLNDDLWSPALDDRMDRLIAEGCDEMILVLPDCITRYGGSQYLNSAATGRYDDYLVDELVPWADRTFRTLGGRDHRGVIGKSSGGYGALVHSMRHPDVFGAAVCHSGDIGFEVCYRPDVEKFWTVVHAAGGLADWFAECQRRRHKTDDDFVALNVLAMAAAYSPERDAAPFGIALPCDLATGAFRDDVWARWLEHEPLHLVGRHVAALRSLALLHVECGIRDEYGLHLGARLLHARLSDLGVAHTYEEFDDGHRNVSYRYDVTLPRLASALKPR